MDPLLVAVFVVGTVLRFWGLGSQSLWYDEWLTSEAVDGSLPDLLRHVANREGIPPTFFLAEWAWVRLVGDGDLALRALSAVAGAATVPVAYGIARELLMSRPVARVTAALVAVHPMLVWYSQEARPYSLLALVGALSFLAFVRVWHRDTQRGLVAWASVAAVAVALHYFAVFLVAAQGAALLLRRPGLWRRLVLAALPSLGVLGLVTPFALKQHSHAPNRLWISGFPLPERLREAGRAALVGPNPPDERLWIPVALIVLLAALATAARPNRPGLLDPVLTVGVAGAAVALPVLLALAGIQDVVVSRYLIASLVPLLVAMGIVLASASRWIAPAVSGLVVVVCLAVSVAVQSDPQLHKPDWQAVADIVEGSDGSAATAVVLNAHGTVAQPLLRYLEHGERVTGDDAVRVQAVDVLYTRPTTRPCNLLVGRACGFVFLGVPPPDPIADELTLARRVVLDQFVVEHYVPTAANSLVVTVDDLVRSQDQRHSLVVVAQL